MGEMLRWPFRVVLYLMLYLAWLVITLVTLAVFPGMTDFQATNLLPAGWIPIAAALFADIYFTQVRKSKQTQENRTPESPEK